MYDAILPLATAGAGLASLAAAWWLLGCHYHRRHGVDAHQLICDSNDRADRALLVSKKRGQVAELPATPAQPDVLLEDALRDAEAILAAGRRDQLARLAAAVDNGTLHQLHTELRRQVTR